MLRLIRRVAIATAAARRHVARGPRRLHRSGSRRGTRVRTALGTGARIEALSNVQSRRPRGSVQLARVAFAGGLTGNPQQHRQRQRVRLRVDGDADTTGAEPAGTGNTAARTIASLMLLTPLAHGVRRYRADDANRCPHRTAGRNVPELGCGSWSREVAVRR